VSTPGSQQPALAARGNLYLLFRVATEGYLLDVREVVEILPLRRLKPITDVPVWVAGIFSYQGELVPVLDLSVLIAQQAAPRLTSTRLVLVQYPLSNGQTRRLGLIMAQATNTLRCAANAFRDYGLEHGESRYLGPVCQTDYGLLQRIRVVDLLSETVRNQLFQETEVAHGEAGHE
jgi:chemotaxis-related protein WspB